MKVVWAITARQDLVHIRSYISRFHSGAAGNLARHILQSAESISRHPELGTGTRLPKIRRLVVSGTPYVIYYKLNDSTIEILEVFDGRRAVPRVLKTDE
jgi:toxin ParE1/3/4